LEARVDRRGLGLRARRRHEHRRGVHRLSPTQSRSAVRAREHRDGAWRRVPASPRLMPARTVRRWFASVRLRTTVMATLVAFVALTAGAVALVAILHQQLRSDLDVSVRTRAAEVASLAAAGTLPAALPPAGE